MQGQQAENLLDFDEPDASVGSAGTSLSSGLASNPATAKILTSNNPLDDLVSIFGNTNINASIPSALTNTGGGSTAMGGVGGSLAVAQAQPRKPQNDLLDLF